jgi:hypothetical protein
MPPRPNQPRDNRDAEQRRAKIAAEIAALLATGPPLPGSLVTRHNRCANRTCRCRADPPQLHGPYPAWTRKVDGTTVTRSLNPDQVARYQSWFDNARRLRDLVTELHRLAVEQAETAEGWPRT